MLTLKYFRPILEKAPVRLCGPNRRFGKSKKRNLLFYFRSLNGARALR